MNAPDYACIVCAEPTTTGFGVEGPPEIHAAALLHGTPEGATEYVQNPLCRGCAEDSGTEVGDLAAPWIPFYVDRAEDR